MAGSREQGGRAPRDLAAPFRVFVGLAFISIVCLTIAQVFFRSVLDDPLIWSEEVVRLLLVWVVFIGAAVVTWDGRHLNVDVVFSRLPRRLRTPVRWFNRVVALVFLTAFGWTSVEIVQLNRWDEIGALDWSMAWVRVPATVGAVLMILAIVLRVVLGHGRHDARADDQPL